MIPAPSLPLHDWSCLRTELIWIYDHEPRPQSRHGVFDHRDGYWAWYLRKGEVRVACKSGELTARAGQWLFLPQEIHRHDFSDDAVLISVRFRCQWPSGENLFASAPGVVLDGSAHPALEKSARALATLVRRHFPSDHNDHARRVSDYPFFLRFQRSYFAWLEAWFDACLASGAPLARHAGDERLARAARVLDETPFAQGFPASALRAATALSAVQLKRLFQRHRQVTPLQYWERRRLETARLLLETGDLPLKEIAARLGFRSNAHFTVWFRRHARTSPGRYRTRNTCV